MLRQVNASDPALDQHAQVLLALPSDVVGPLSKPRRQRLPSCSPHPPPREQPQQRNHRSQSPPTYTPTLHPSTRRCRPRCTALPATYRSLGRGWLRGMCETVRSESYARADGEFESRAEWSPLAGSKATRAERVEREEKEICRRPLSEAVAHLALLPIAPATLAWKDGTLPVPQPPHFGPASLPSSPPSFGGSRGGPRLVRPPRPRRVGSLLQRVGGQGWAAGDGLAAVWVSSRWSGGLGERRRLGGGS